MERDEIEDSIIIMEKVLEALKEQREQLQHYSEDIAESMILLKSNYGKQLLATLTQDNYCEMIELEVEIAEMEKKIQDVRRIRRGMIDGTKI